MSYQFTGEASSPRYGSAPPGDARDGSVLRLQAAEILDLLGHAIGHDLDVARQAAHRLVHLLTPGGPIDALQRGGLAPWQKRKIDRYLGAHLEHPIYVETLAEALPLSVSHFCRAFKESFGETPHAHIMRLRLERARRLMLETDEPLSQIALACGLSDQAHLSKLFRRHMGESPSRWRRRHRPEPGGPFGPL